MSVTYSSIGWNRHKRLYDACAAGVVLLFLLSFVGASVVALPEQLRPDPVVLTMRALGACAVTLLHIILGIGPLTRLDRRFLPLLYNRRHLGVMMFLIALAHAFLATGYYHGFGIIQPLVSLLANSSRGGIPFELFGLCALVILFLMAATSHDFWLKNLGPRAWKSLHMGVYLAYLLVVVHVSLGAIRGDEGRITPTLMLLGALTLGGLHLVAGRREVRADRGRRLEGSGWICAGSVDDIPEKRARTVCAGNGERIAVFRFDGKISAVSNVCEHQHGPLGEGKIIGGCITCPWHGYQYLPESGASPPPFTEKIATYRVRVEGRSIYIDPHPLPRGTAIDPARFEPAQLPMESSS